MRAYKKLTQKKVDGARPSNREYTLWDYQVPGFGLRVRPTGAKTYNFVYRTVGRKQRRICIGKPGVLTLKEARAAAIWHAQEVYTGGDPAKKKAKARKTTVDAVYETYRFGPMRYLSHGHRVRVNGIFQNIILPELGQKTIASITRQDIRAITDKITATGKKAMANNVHRVMSAFLAWVTDWGDILESNPLSGSRLPNRPTRRERFLQPSELARIWHACKELDPRWCAGIRLLMLTGQRRGEVFGAEICEFNLPRKSWSIPAIRTKNGDRQVVHLSSAALVVINEAPKNGVPKYLLQSDKTKEPRPVSSNVPIKKLKNMVSITDWRLHDLRRSVATHMARQGVAQHVIAAVLNHKSGYRTGVTAIYNRYDYRHEAAEAWDIWGSTLEKWLKVHGTPDEGCYDDDYCDL